MRIVVIGGNAAAMSAAARARRLAPSADIVVLERGPHVSWGACGLPFYVEGQVPSLDALMVHPPEYFRNERGIDVRTNVEAAAIRHSRRQVALTAGEPVGYDKLILATGARPDTAGVRGAESAFTLATMQDGERLRARLRQSPPRRAAIIGAGYLGLELAGTLRTHGAEVTVFEACREVLSRDDSALTDVVEAHLNRCRVELRTGVRVAAVEPDRVADLPCDLVVLTTGFRPNVELAVEAGVELGRTGAIGANDRLETNVTGIFAAGDCAESSHLVTGRPVYVPLGTTANKMGRVAGANAAGARERFPGIAGTTITRVCGLAVAVTGLSESQARREGLDPVSARITAPDRGRSFFGTNTTAALVADRRTRQIIGGWIAGEHGVAGRVNVIAAALTAHMRIEDFEQLDLAYAPPYASVWDPLLICAQQLVKAL